MKDFDFILKRFGALVCMGKGHRRGKRMLRASMPAGTPDNVIGYRCVRCGATWTRKMRKAKE